MIEVTNLTKIYGDHAAVRNLSFKLVNGRIYGLLGPNGAGKSTTMNMMTGCLAPTYGTVSINGYDIYEQPLDAKRFIGYLPEQPPLYTDMTPEEYLTFVAEAKGVLPSRLKRQVEQVMERTNITDMKDRLIKHLSKGYCQRVGIAQAMLGDPEIIILDEPTVGLDPKQIFEIRELIRTLSEQCTIIISSHILAEISELCDELLVISNGSLVASGTLEELEQMLGDTQTLHLTVRGDSEGVCAVLDMIEGASDYEHMPATEEGTVRLSIRISRGADLRDDIFFKMAESRYAVLSMEYEQQTLESVFLTLTEQAPAEQEPTEHASVTEKPDAQAEIGQEEGSEQ
ncbi:MAG: ABC transporter ATP-binding protein [Clostridia bacterium]|nr:ABC transporter ATP-binding protein [Clostridia bacterium]